MPTLPSHVGIMPVHVTEKTMIIILTRKPLIIVTGFLVKFCFI